MREVTGLEPYTRRQTGEQLLSNPKKDDDKVDSTHTNPIHFSSNEEEHSLSIISKIRKQMEEKVSVSQRCILMEVHTSKMIKPKKMTTFLMLKKYLNLESVIHNSNFAHPITKRKKWN